MSQKLTYAHYLSLPVKVRKSVICEVLINKWNFVTIKENNYSDKAYKKALTAFQKDHCITPNGMVCEKTFNALQIGSFTKS